MNKNTKESQNYDDDEDFNYEYDESVEDDSDKIFRKFENSKKHLTISKNENNLNLNNKKATSEQIDSSDEDENQRKNLNEIQTNKNVNTRRYINQTQIGVHYLHNIDKLKSNDKEEEKEEKGKEIFKVILYYLFVFTLNRIRSSQKRKQNRKK